MKKEKNPLKQEKNIHKENKHSFSEGLRKILKAGPMPSKKKK